jgi:hypothetical protein
MIGEYDPCLGGSSKLVIQTWELARRVAAYATEVTGKQRLAIEAFPAMCYWIIQYSRKDKIAKAENFILERGRDSQHISITYRKDYTECQT